MNKKQMGIAALPHPRKISNALRIIIGLALLTAGILGMAHSLYSAVIPAEIVSLFPQELYSISRANIIFIISFVSMFAGLIVLMKRN